MTDWLQDIGVLDPESGYRVAESSLDRILEPGRRVLGVEPTMTPTLLLFQGFLARAQALHQASVSATRAGNPAAAFTLLRAQAENAAAILYATDHPQRHGSFLGAPGQHPVRIGRMVTNASGRFGAFDAIYAQLSEFAHPGTKGLLVSSQLREERTLNWSSVPRFRSDQDQVIAYGWIVELAEASHHLLFEFAQRFKLGPFAGEASDSPQPETGSPRML